MKAAKISRRYRQVSRNIPPKSLFLSGHHSLFFVQLCCFRRFLGVHSRVLFATRTPNSQNHSYVHYSLSEFTGEWFTNHSNHIHIFTPITRIVATKVCSHWASSDIPKTLLTPTPSHGRAPLHRQLSRPKMFVFALLLPAWISGAIVSRPYLNQLTSHPLVIEGTYCAYPLVGIPARSASLRCWSALRTNFEGH